MTVIQDMTPLEDVERQRGEFLGRVSEELRVPLATIKGSAIAMESVLESTTSRESTQLLRIIDQQTDLMRSQVNSLTELTQIETGSLSVAAEPTDVCGLIQGSCREYLGDHPAISVQLDVPRGLPTVSADRKRISQVLHNFLRQAVMHSNESAPVRVSASVLDIYVAISVSVEGALERNEATPSYSNKTESPDLYKGISQAHNKTAEFYSEGEGLALAFCRGVVEAHGGRMKSEVEEAGKLSLTFTLPSLEDDEEIRTPQINGIAHEQSPVSTEKSQILVSIEDPRLLATVRRDLLHAGYTPVIATGLAEVERLAIWERPKLALLDMAGREEECFRTLQRAGSTLNLPAIVLCDRHDEEHVVRALDMGADGYMRKPFSPSELIARIKAILRRSTTGVGSSDDQIFQLGEILVNFHERTVKVSGQQLQLTATEYRLITELSRFAGRVLTQDELLQRVWGPEYMGESQLLRSYIKSLRQKLGDDARNPSYIFTEHGIGYRMAKSLPKTNQPAPVGFDRGSVAHRSRGALHRNGN